MIRDIYANVRFSKEELDVVKRKMDELGYSSRSSYIRKTAMYGFIVKTNAQSFEELTSAFHKVEYEINKIGTNINQIARKLNSDDEVIIDEFVEIKKQLEEIKKETIDTFAQAFNENEEKRKERSTKYGLH